MTARADTPRRTTCDCGEEDVKFKESGEPPALHVRGGRHQAWLVHDRALLRFGQLASEFRYLRRTASMAPAARVQLDCCVGQSPVALARGRARAARRIANAAPLLPGVELAPAVYVRGAGGALGPVESALSSRPLCPSCGAPAGQRDGSTAGLVCGDCGARWRATSPRGGAERKRFGPAWAAHAADLDAADGAEAAARRRCRQRWPLLARDVLPEAYP